jgi:hypothetical protein
MRSLKVNTSGAGYLSVLHSHLSKVIPLNSKMPENPNSSLEFVKKSESLREALSTEHEKSWGRAASRDNTLSANCRVRD